jgi:hypothetical protein
VRLGACEGDTCPASGSAEDSVCTALSCVGKDTKCTSGNHKDCESKQPDCPDLTKGISFVMMIAEGRTLIGSVKA